MSGVRKKLKERSKGICSTGTCRYCDRGVCEIRIFVVLRKVHPDTDLKNVLLHEMIHAFLWINCGKKEHRRTLEKKLKKWLISANQGRASVEK
ncbi:uncharacterized protein M6B38_394185 [Iris pallida]|uniref:SprT-like domain-containing protein n=1 Tax=Iris pallida TaxID=29817 RepID=A0AAX6FY27_IRIPA|nr:uncharacterized protein M6B38_394185 [Iris pallida]